MRGEIFDSAKRFLERMNESAPQLRRRLEFSREHGLQYERDQEPAPDLDTCDHRSRRVVHHHATDRIGL